MTAKELKKHLDEFFWEGPPYHSRPIHRTHREIMQQFDVVRDYCDERIKEEEVSIKIQQRKGA